MSTHAQLLAEIEAYILAAGISAKQFGLLAKRDYSLVYRMRAGRDVTARTIDQCKAFMAANPPKKSVARQRRQDALAA